MTASRPLALSGTNGLDTPHRAPRRRLGPAGPQVGAVGYGAMGLSWAYGDPDPSPERYHRVLQDAADSGACMVDTADLYGPFTNEILVGEALRGRRDDVVLATKGGLYTTDPAVHAVHRNGRPEHLRAAAKASLRRLGTDVIDLYYLHRVDEQVPLADQWGTLAELVTEGDVRQIGLSEGTVEQLQQAHAQHPVAAVQSELSLWTRDHLTDVVPWCANHQAAFVAYAPLGRGWLTGTTPASFEPGDFRARNPRYAAAARTDNLALVDIVRTVAERHGRTPAQVAHGLGPHPRATRHRHPRHDPTRPARREPGSRRPGAHRRRPHTTRRPARRDRRPVLTQPTTGNP